MLIHEKQYNNVQELAKAIANLPSNHDELEMLIADMIKKHIHYEKYMIYRNLQQWKGAGLEWIFTRIIDPKTESHKEFAEKWCYNTDYSIANYGKDKSKIIPTALSKALKSTGAKVEVTHYEYIGKTNKDTV